MPNKYLYLTLFTGSIIILHQILQKLLGIPLPFLDNYLDPFLCIPFLLGGFTLERRYLLQLKDFQMSRFEIFSATIALSLVFEYIFPLFSRGFVCDPWDFMAYALGAIVFERVGNRSTGF